MAAAANQCFLCWDEWMIEMLEKRRRRRWIERVSVIDEEEEDMGSEETEVSKDEEEEEYEAGEKGEEETVMREEVEMEEGGENEVGREVKDDEEDDREVNEADEWVDVEEEENDEESEAEREVKENEEVDEVKRPEEEEEEEEEVEKEVERQVKENEEVDEVKRAEEGDEEEEVDEDEGEEAEEGEEEENEVEREVKENGEVDEMMVKVAEENEFEREVKAIEELEEVGGDENEVEEEVDVEESRQVREEEQVEEEDDEVEENQVQEQIGQYHHAELFREHMRRTEDEQQNQESVKREHKQGNGEENMSDSVDSDNEDSDFTESEDGFYNVDRIKNGETAVEEQYKDPEELEDLDENSCRNENGIRGAWTSEERKEDESERSTDEKETVAESRTNQEEEFHLNLQNEEEESTDDEEAEHPTDEQADSDDEEVVKIFCKEDYRMDMFHTLTEFRDSSLLTDLTLSTEDGKSFHVHSLVLAAVSSHIRERLPRSNVDRVDERKDTCVGVRRWSVSLGPEVDHVGLKAVVEFAYTGLMSCLNKNTLHQVKAAAQTLGAHRVLDLCKEEEEKSMKTEGQKKAERISAAEQMMISLQSIKQLWMDGVGCDVILDALGGSLHVHRVILAVCSDYFRGMFTLGMRESHQPRVTLPFLLASELEVLTDCSYSGALPLSWKCVFEITSTALQLQYQPALSLCLNFLHQEINVDSCLDVASFAEAYEMVQLLEVADDFILRQFQKVACTSKFRDLPATKMIKYLNSRSLCVPSELVVFKAVVAWIQAKPRIRLRFAEELMKTINFPLMTFKEFKEVQSMHMWSDHSLAELYEAVLKDFCSNDSQCRIYLPKESLVLIGGDQISEDLSSRSISRDLWFGNSLRNHTGVNKSMEWRKLGEMPKPERFDHEVALLKGQLYVFGGKKYYGISDTLSSVYRFDPLQNSWESLAEMQEKRCSFSVVVLDGKIYAIGGNCDLDYMESVEQYCTTGNSWSFMWPLDLPVAGHVAKVLQGQIFVSGGLSGNHQHLASLFVYHPETGSTYLANMAKPRARHCMETLGECLYVAGGTTTNDNMGVVDQLACEVYNPVADSWTAFASLPMPHVGAGGAVLEGKFYVLGGYSQDYSETKKVHRYDPAIQRWENMGKMPGPNSDIRAAVLCLPPHFRL